MRGFVAVALGLVVSAGALVAEDARAAGSYASPTGKGITGGALLGAEAVMLTEAAAGVKPGWAYAVGGGLGAAAGGVGGYFAEQGDTKISFYLLLGGMALILPTTVAVLSTTAYEPVNYVEDRPPADEPVAEPAAPSPAPAAKPTSRRALPHTTTVALHRTPPALIGVGGGELSLSVPAVEVRQMYTRTEVATLGVKQGTEVDVPVLNIAF